MEQNDQSLALPRGGHERSSVRKPRPGLGRKARVRFGEHLARNGYLIGDSQAKKWALAVEGRKFFRGIPGHRAAQHAAAPAQPDGDEIVGGRGEMGSGKAHEDAAVLDKACETVMRLTRHQAGIGKDHDRHMVVEKRAYWIGGGRPCLADVREGGKRLGEIIAWREQRLRDVRRFAADEADPAAAPALVEKKNRRRRMFASDFEAGDLVAQFDGHLETGLRLLRRAKLERCFAEREPLAIERADNALFRTGEGRAEHPHIEAAGLVFHACERANGCRIRYNSEFAGNRRKLARKLPRMAAIESIGDPNNRGFFLLRDGIFFDRGKNRQPVGNKRHGL